MKQVIRKFYYDFEKEEKWINEMAAKGLCLTDYSWGRYVFEEGAKGEYVYRLELLDNLATHPESKAYIQFLEESGIELVSTYFRWIFLRKKNSEGPFDIYSDLESKIKHYKRVTRLLLTVTYLEFFIGTLNIMLGLFMHSSVDMVNVLLGSVCVILGAVFLKVSLPFQRKLRKLKEEKLIHE